MAWIAIIKLTLALSLQGRPPTCKLGEHGIPLASEFPEELLTCQVTRPGKVHDTTYDFQDKKANSKLFKKLVNIGHDQKRKDVTKRTSLARVHVKVEGHDPIPVALFTPMPFDEYLKAVENGDKDRLTSLQLALAEAGIIKDENRKRSQKNKMTFQEALESLKIMGFDLNSAVEVDTKGAYIPSTRVSVPHCEQLPYDGESGMRARRFDIFSTKAFKSMWEATVDKNAKNVDVSSPSISDGEAIAKHCKETLKLNFEKRVCTEMIDDDMQRPFLKVVPFRCVDPEGNITHFVGTCLQVAHKTATPENCVFEKGLPSMQLNSQGIRRSGVELKENRIWKQTPEEDE